MEPKRQANEQVPPAPEPARPLEGLSGMGARIGRVSQDADQVGHVERQGFRREEQQQIEERLEEDAPTDRSLEPHEDKGFDR